MVWFAKLCARLQQHVISAHVASKDLVCNSEWKVKSCHAIFSFSRFDLNFFCRIAESIHDQFIFSYLSVHRKVPVAITEKVRMRHYRGDIKHLSNDVLIKLVSVEYDKIEFRGACLVPTKRIYRKNTGERVSRDVDRE